ncbi:MAG: 1,4-alpha-glucan branching protein GlgB [Candidatus Thiodiazotropha sp. (ex Dulcina madagascariensis)]|nr:1,4-alpha-glucan branching protein GlgB [Candidatus Thiodiazotropha sp. (ex Dulcina madagascariensis)]
MTDRMTNTIPEALQRIIDARHHDPFEVLGRHVNGDVCRIRVFMPLAEKVMLQENRQELLRNDGTDFFELEIPADQVSERYLLEWQDKYGHTHQSHDPYCFPPQLPEFDIHLFSEGKHRHAYRFFGSHPHQADGIGGILFAVWAPNATRVSIVGTFNQWDGRAHPMRSRGGSGVWELFIPGLEVGALYKFEIRTQEGHISLRTDPYGNQFQCRPETAAIVVHESEYVWRDEGWMQSRATINWQQQPMSVYEIHLGSWRRDQQGEFLNYREIAHQLCNHIKRIGFTHIELLPITEHPLDGSWGYQTTGYFAPTSRFGTPDDFRYFVDHLHRNGIGVLLDWVPAHFPRDRHALAQFDGSALYEHQDPRKGEHRDWGTLIFNFGRNEVRNFLISSAIYWLEEFHIDGLRVDAVASMLYLDYSREPGDWVPNQYGGRENLEAVDFLRELNSVTHDLHPGTLMIAEESTAWPQVSRPTWLGGLGFSMKWNMGWMHDTLSYMSQDPIYRHYHHDLLTFGLLYAFTENFVLPFSHDEVVHGKGSMLDKMPGDEWQKFANLRLLYTYMYTYPGKKLLFMGCEFAQGREWSDDDALDWSQQEHPYHQGITTLLTDLNQLYKTLPALHQIEFEYPGFDWIDCHDSSQSILSYLRKDRDGGELLVVLNFTPVPREDYRIGVNHAGIYREIMNSDSEFYGGSNTGNGAALASEETSWMGRDQSISLTLPPLGAIILQKEF